MLFKHFLQQLDTIIFPINTLPVYETIRAEIQAHFSSSIPVIDSQQWKSGPKPELKLHITPNPPDMQATDKKWIHAILKAPQRLELTAAFPAHLYLLWRQVLEDWSEIEIEKLQSGYYHELPFKRLDSQYDVFIVGDARTNRHFQAEPYFQQLARTGFTHVEVNGLATAIPIEQENGRTDESYGAYYSHSPDLEQFVETELTQGTFPAEYLAANLNRLKKIANYALKYGLSPGFGAYSPRSMPESFFRRYPTLRGPRIDHPFRSYQPRYAMTLGHPAVREHYQQMLKNVMEAVPELDYYAIRPNDSGAGFEYTLSLYAGANGGPYLVREWKSLKELHQAAGRNIGRYYQLMAEAGQSINLNFRVITELTHFDEEQPHILPFLKPPIDLIFFMSPGENEHSLLKTLQQQGCEKHYFGGFGPGKFPPLLGTPFPWYLWQQLKQVQIQDFENLIYCWGINPPDLVPYSINEEIVRLFQINPAADVEQEIQKYAQNWVGKEIAPHLVTAWQLTDHVIEQFKGIPLYSYFAFVWFRTWVRALVPNIEKIPAAERDYHEKYVVTTFNNPNRVDLACDCLWQIDPEQARQLLKQLDEEILPTLEKALVELNPWLRDPTSLQTAAYAVIIAQQERIRALKCWMANQRDVAAWIVSVHGYLDAKMPDGKDRYRQMVIDMVARQIQHTEDLLDLWRTARTEFMAISDFCETTFVYG
ncbi:hypothetical protein JW964_07090, partial [candidate division KSB1 bacterium]|nr:hypothetical protein [candidate division KSB1 bacterium]